MSAMSSDRPVQLVESTPAADPAPLGLAGFALTTFLLSGHNASFIPDLIWVGPAIFYGGLAQFAAGMWEFRNRNVFGATAFSTYGGFWMGLGLFVILGVDTSRWLAAYAGGDLTNALAWFLFAFAIFNTYMLIASMQVNIGRLRRLPDAGDHRDPARDRLLQRLAQRRQRDLQPLAPRRRLGRDRDRGVAWYASAAGVMNGVSGRVMLPVGKPFTTARARSMATA